MSAPQFGKSTEEGVTALVQLTPLQIQTYLYQKLREGLSPNTVIKHYTLLFTVLGQAVQLGLLQRNPME